MLCQVQNAVSEVLVKKFKGNKKLMNYVLGNHTYSIVAVNDDTFINTHSMPSGSYLTAVLNSLVNRFYKAMWYYRNVPNAKPFNFPLDVIDMVYGDDTVNAVKNPALKDKLNAVTMKDFFISLGMDFTTSTKGVVDKPFEDLSDITFLKRSFRFHPILSKISCPLDLKTIFSGLSWFDKGKELDVVLYDKINAFQREIFLHYDIYEKCLLALSTRCSEVGLTFVRLPEQYLVNLYNAGFYDEYYNSKFGLLNSLSMLDPR